MTQCPLHGRIDGPIVMIGFGSIGRGTLPLIERHFNFDRSRFVVIDPDDSHRALLDERGLRFEKAALTRENYREILTPLLSAGGGQGFCVNLSVDTSSLDIMELARELGALYIDTVVEPWPGFILINPWGQRHAPIMPCAKPFWRRGAKIPAGQPPSLAAAPIPAWSLGLSNKHC